MSVLLTIAGLAVLGLHLWWKTLDWHTKTYYKNKLAMTVWSVGTAATFALLFAPFFMD